MKISEILIGNRRAIGCVKSLASSIEAVGLLNPVTVTRGSVLVAGAHRIEAYKLLGLDDIPATIVDLDEVDAELAEIDENLIRNDGTELEQCTSLARRKVLYLIKYPETGHGKKPTSKEPIIGFLPKSFVQDTVDKTDKRKTTIKLKASIGETLEDLQDEIVEAGIDAPPGPGVWSANINRE